MKFDFGLAITGVDFYHRIISGRGTFSLNLEYCLYPQQKYIFISIGKFYYQLTDTWENASMNSPSTRIFIIKLETNWKIILSNTIILFQDLQIFKKRLYSILMYKLMSVSGDFVIKMIYKRFQILRRIVNIIKICSNSATTIQENRVCKQI